MMYEEVDSTYNTMTSKRKFGEMAMQFEEESAGIAHEMMQAIDGTLHEIRKSRDERSDAAATSAVALPEELHALFTGFREHLAATFYHNNYC